MNKYKDFTILVPCYNEEETIGSVLVQMLSLNPKNIVIVDDGSTDKSAEIIQYLQNFGNIVLLQHTKNVGVGSALKSGFKYCSNLDTKYIITVDADNQHSKVDAKRVMNEILKKDVLIASGIRKFHRHIPLKKKFANFVARSTFMLLYGINNPDPLCGLRAYRREILPELLNLENGYDWIVSVNKLAKRHSKESVGIDIDAIYTPYSLSSKSLTYLKGLQMLKNMISMEFKNKVELLLDNRYADTGLEGEANVILPRKRLKPMNMLDERLFFVPKFD